MLPGKKYTPEEVLWIAWRRRWLLLVPCAVIAAAAAAFSWTLPDRYRSETLILVVPQRVPESYVRSTVTTRIEDRLQSISPQILSRTRLERIILDFKLYAGARRIQPMEDVVETMRRDVDVNIVKGDAFRVAYTGENPQVVAAVANRLASLFIEENLRDREVLAEGTNQFLEAQLEDARTRLIAHEQKLEAYRKQYAGQLPSQQDANLQVIQNTQMQIQSVVDSINRDRDRRLVLERSIEVARSESDASVGGITSLPGTGGAPPTATDGESGGSVLQQLDVARARLRDLEARLTPAHPDVAREKRVIRELESRAAAEGGSPSATRDVLDPVSRSRKIRLKQLQYELDNLDRQISGKEAQEQRLRATASGYQARVEAAPARETELTELMRDYTTLQSLYSSLLQKKEDSKMAANLERRQIGEQFKLLDPAMPAEKPFTPNRARIVLLAALAGLAAGLAMASLLEYRDTTFATDDEAKALLKIPVLASVPTMLTAMELRRSRRWRWLLDVGCASVMLVCGAIVAWTIVRPPLH